MMRGSDRSMGEDACSRFVNRMVNLPRSILEGVTRAMGQGIDLMGLGPRRNDHFRTHFPYQHPQQQPMMIQEEGAFLASFEQQYGTMHPFFYACRFVDALKIAQDEHKFVFMYIHSPEHPFTPSFCRETLSSELVVQFLDTNFVSWSALANRGEGLHMASTLQPASFPFCAVVAPAPGDNISVLQQMEGPVSPAELVEILQGTLEEQGLAFGSAWAKEEEKRRADRRLREHQDVAYIAALQIDQEKEKRQNATSEQNGQKQVESSNKMSTSQQKIQKQAEASTKANAYENKQNPVRKQDSKLIDITDRGAQQKRTASRGKDAQPTQILIRFPNGERKEQSFLCTDKVQAIFRYIDSLGKPGVGNYRLVSGFPRKVYGVDQMGMTLKDAGLHPRASLFLELLT